MNWMKRAAALVAAVWMSVAGAVMASDSPAVFEVGTLRASSARVNTGRRSS